MTSIVTRPQSHNLPPELLCMILENFTDDPRYLLWLCRKGPSFLRNHAAAVFASNILPELHICLIIPDPKSCPCVYSRLFLEHGGPQPKSKYATFLQKTPWWRRYDYDLEKARSGGKIEEATVCVRMVTAQWKIVRTKKQNVLWDMDGTKVKWRVDWQELASMFFKSREGAEWSRNPYVRGKHEGLYRVTCGTENYSYVRHVECVNHA